MRAFYARHGRAEEWAKKEAAFIAEATMGTVDLGEMGPVQLAELAKVLQVRLIELGAWERKVKSALGATRPTANKTPGAR